jgi:hypothetical protein
MKTNSIGKEGIGPAGYLPSCYVNELGEEIKRPDIDSQLKYNMVKVGIIRLQVTP